MNTLIFGGYNGSALLMLRLRICYVTKCILCALILTAMLLLSLVDRLLVHTSSYLLVNFLFPFASGSPAVTTSGQETRNASSEEYRYVETVCEILSSLYHEFVLGMPRRQNFPP